MRLNNNGIPRLLVATMLPTLATVLATVPHLTGHWKEIDDARGRQRMRRSIAWLLAVFCVGLLPGSAVAASGQAP
ncbi:MAG: hypothetical protein AVDCRST_MAG93-3588, partial [uncultured Chloroflexia bacterium]